MTSRWGLLFPSATDNVVLVFWLLLWFLEFSAESAVFFKGVRSTLTPLPRLLLESEPPPFLPIWLLLLYWWYRSSSSVFILLFTAPPILFILPTRNLSGSSISLFSCYANNIYCYWIISASLAAYLNCWSTAATVPLFNSTCPSASSAFVKCFS